MKQNYRQAKRQKELARKARQQEKQTKRAGARPDGDPEPAPGVEGAADTAAGVGDTPAAPAAGTDAS